MKFRQKLIETREREGLTIAAVAARFGVGVASVVRWLKDTVPNATRDKPATKIDVATLSQDVRDHSDAYHNERAARLGVSKSGICDAMKRLGVTLKKTLAHPKATEEGRRSFRERIATHEAAGRTIVYIDESGFSHDMPRRHGYALRGQRCHGKRAWNACGRINVIGAMLAGALLTVGLTEANVNAGPKTRPDPGLTPVGALFRH